MLLVFGLFEKDLILLLILHSYVVAEGISYKLVRFNVIFLVLKSAEALRIFFNISWQIVKLRTKFFNYQPPTHKFCRNMCSVGHFYMVCVDTDSFPKDNVLNSFNISTMAKISLLFLYNLFKLGLIFCCKKQLACHFGWWQRQIVGCWHLYGCQMVGWSWDKRESFHIIWFSLCWTLFGVCRSWFGGRCWASMLLAGLRMQSRTSACLVVVNHANKSSSWATKHNLVAFIFSLTVSNFLEWRLDG